MSFRFWHVHCSIGLYIWMRRLRGWIRKNTMSINLSSLLAQWLVCFSGLVICVLTQLPAEAAGGDIIISREVKPRAAARQELVPDPNPQLVNPNNAHQVHRALGIRSGA